MHNYSYYISCVSLLSQRHLQGPQEAFFYIFQLKSAGKIYSFSGSQKTMAFVQEGCWASSKQRINDITKNYYFSTYFILALYHSLTSVFLQDLIKSQKKKSYWKIRLALKNKGSTVFCVRSSFFQVKSDCTCTQISLNKNKLYLLANVKLTHQDLLYLALY